MEVSDMFERLGFGGADPATGSEAEHASPMFLRRELDLSLAPAARPPPRIDLWAAAQRARAIIPARPEASSAHGFRRRDLQQDSPAFSVVVS